MTLFSGIRSLFLISEGPEQHLDLYSYILPFVGLIMAASVKRAFSISAKVPYIMIKITIIVMYLVVYVLSI